MTRTAGGRPPKIDYALLRAWWLAGVCARDIADHFGCHVLTVSHASRRLGLPRRAPHQPVITLARYRADRRAAIADLAMAQIKRAAAETRGAMACAEMVDAVGRNSLTAWQRGIG